MKKFKITYNVGEFTVPEFDDDEAYEELAEILFDLANMGIDTTKIYVELVDEPDEIKEKYIINRDCQD